MNAHESNIIDAAFELTAFCKGPFPQEMTPRFFELTQLVDRLDTACRAYKQARLAATPDAGEDGELLDHYKSEAEDYYWLLQTGHRVFQGWLLSEIPPSLVHEKRMEWEALRAAKSNSPSAGAVGGNRS